MTEYRWKWGKPDHPGVWAWGGVHRTDSKFISALHVANHSVSATGWWCFLVDLPTILPPKKKTVWRMWVVPYCQALEQPSVYTPIWCKDGERPGDCSAIRTDKTEEREE